ncbi:serine O-acetyltransferase EpsC [Rathayibacter iranicus]|uniref:Serine acetyltransferase n=2 Tax=Rathayibacter iranicus TaxID=59737 RepID=A0AAD1AGW3_9MICO|nr:serine O-acetyltransferase EpsC [Rathayibacter iranicus]AZZ57040.1 serine O-acetyltransferase [Rathayibacter iranicus]MWV29655.1 serine O-acetyltransferase [Rathayibacter iranicus NCPPB 2253 = VKM Ac-1602]PPI41816.1 serine O-acetyltransferase [Rathayibacter iranicus]PPI57706.1 serine O-acetyltransferase [Rathayibacter iranicus]PPI68508.1 serine O-acetyltransferase [Rathayibacter iranicus]
MSRRGRDRLPRRRISSETPDLGVLARLREDVRTARRRDPAARSAIEVVLGYPGVHAVWAHRVAHAWWRRGLRLPARLLSQAARVATGVEIHPGATIGRRLFIDHGMGVVIGETARIGDDCLLYHGVTLGGKSGRRERRHPALGDRVVVGAGAVVLGPIVLGSDVSVGANAVVVRDAPDKAVLVGIPARNLRVHGHADDALADSAIPADPAAPDDSADRP